CRRVLRHSRATSCRRTSVVLLLTTRRCLRSIFFFFFNAPAPTEIYTLSLHDALPISFPGRDSPTKTPVRNTTPSALIWSTRRSRSEEHTSELQSLRHLVCRLLLEKKKKKKKK